MTVMMSTSAQGLEYGSRWWISRLLLLILGCPISTTAQSGMTHGAKEWEKRYEVLSNPCNFYGGGSFLSFAYMNIFCCGSTGWIALIQTGFNRPRYLLQNKETDARFSEAWLISVSSGSKFYIYPTVQLHRVEENICAWLCSIWRASHSHVSVFLAYIVQTQHTNALVQVAHPLSFSNKYWT